MRPNWKRRRPEDRSPLDQLVSLWERCVPSLAIQLARRPQALGRLGEQLAARHLAAEGWTLLGRSVPTPFAEIDLVCRQGELLICVEVKTGRIRTDHTDPMLPRDRLRPRRLARQQRAARHLAIRHRLPADRCRVDLFEWTLRRSRGRPLAKLQGVHLRDVAHPSSRPACEPF